jgi:hypothetical protein
MTRRCLEIAPGVFRPCPDNVTPIVSASAVDAAWDEWCALVDQRHRDNLWKDPAHNQRMARAWDRWRRLYLQTEHGN